MLTLNDSRTILEGDIQLSDCEKELKVRWLSKAGQASFFIGDDPYQQDAIGDFITGNHSCLIDLETYRIYLRQVAEILERYGSMYYDPQNNYFDETVSRFNEMQQNDAEIILHYSPHSRYIRILNNKKDYKINRQMYEERILENGDRFRHSFVGDITTIRIEKNENNDRPYLLKIRLRDNWRDVIMQEHGKKVDLESLVKIFNDEMKDRKGDGLSDLESARVFGIKYEPLLTNNKDKFTENDIVKASDYGNVPDVLNGVKEGMKLSPSVIWRTSPNQGSPINDRAGEQAQTSEPCGYNLIVYGTPGCGKSYFVENKLLGFGKYSINDIEKDGLGIPESMRIRTTFFQDYTNTDFVGQILPKVDDKKVVTYDFVPGPFAMALRRAFDPKNGRKPVALIIEELNRGSGASIFGDIFQLLDRDETGKSVYSITNSNIVEYINELAEDNPDWKPLDKVYIPSNLFIIATMNTSDQNVFTLDTAFKRRWRFEKLANDFTPEHLYKNYFVPGFSTDYTYENIIKSINEFMTSNAEQFMNEDKQIGIYFLEKGQLIENKMTAPTTEQKREVAFKLFEYLWDDVSRMQHDFLFRSEIKTLDQLLEDFEAEGEKVFVPELQDIFNKNK